MTLTATTPPAIEPVTLDQAKAYLRVTHDAEDDLIATLVLAARQRVEAELGVALIATGFHEALDAASEGAIALSRAPLIAVSAVVFVTASGAAILAPETYVARTGARDAQIAPAPNNVWPIPVPPLGGIGIDYTAGFGATAEEVPGPLKQAILTLVGYAYDCRGELDPAPAALIEPWLAAYRRVRL